MLNSLNSALFFAATHNWDYESTCVLTIATAIRSSGKNYGCSADISAVVQKHNGNNNIAMQELSGVSHVLSRFVTLGDWSVTVNEA